MNKKCLLIDKLILDGWFDSEKEALPWVMARHVLVDNHPATSCKARIPVNSEIRIKEYYKKKYVNKGGLKLEGALRDFNIDIKDKVALDCGASTGGFTDCLILHGARKVYAVDAGFGQLAGKLAIHPKVVNLERTNLGDPSLLKLDPVPEIITLDLSYLSLVQALPLCQKILGDTSGIAICLVKPIYEVHSSDIRKTGRINDKNILRDVLASLCDEFKNQKLSILGITNSPVTGNNGTLEFFIETGLNDRTEPVITGNIDDHIERVLDKAFTIVKFDKNNVVLNSE